MNMQEPQTWNDIIERNAAITAAYTTELAFCRKLGNAFFYYHQECGNPEHHYENVNRADIALDAMCMGCHARIAEAPDMHWDA